MKRKRDFVITMKTFVVEFLFQIWINENIDVVFQLQWFTKFVNANVIDMQHVDVNDDQNRSFVKILIVENTNMKIKIYNINEINLWIFEKQIIVFSWNHFIIFRDYRIIDIENVANKFDYFLTILFVKRKILKTHIND